MRDYELMVVLDPNLDEEAVEAVKRRVTSVVTQRNGEVQAVQDWGRRRLAYPVGRFRDATYVLMRFRASAGVSAEVERTLRLTETVMRFLVVRAESLAPIAASA